MRYTEFSPLAGADAAEVGLPFVCSLLLLFGVVFVAGSSSVFVLRLSRSSLARDVRLGRITFAVGVLCGERVDALGRRFVAAVPA
jgi:hypothetical protein